MHCLSVKQPWATLLVGGSSRCLCRAWRTFYRGPLAIQASSRFSRDDIELCCQPAMRRHLERNGFSYAMELPLSSLVGTAELVECAYVTPEKRGQLDCADAAVQFGVIQPGRWIWVFRNPKRLAEPVPMPGRRGLFRIPGRLVGS